MKQTVQEIFQSPACSVYQIPVLTDNYIYILREHQQGLTAVIDAAEAAPVMAFLDSHKWSLDVIYNTHHHQDHIGGNAALVESYACPVYASRYDSERQRIPGVNHPLGDGDHLTLGGIRLDVLATPGHTLGHIVYFLPEQKILFCGDTVFVMGCGRLFEGSAEIMWQSLEKILALPDQTLICCAHEYTLANARFVSQLAHVPPSFPAYLESLQSRRTQQLPTVPSRLAEEKLFNPFLKSKDPAWAQALGRSQLRPAELFGELRREKDHSR